MAAVAALALSGACGGSGDDAKATGRFGNVHTGVCEAVAEAEAGDLEAARRAFDDAHLGLHDLASAAGEADRSVEARLLQVKQRAEADLSEATLAPLVEPVAAAVEVTGGTAPETCP